MSQELSLMGLSRVIPHVYQDLCLTSIKNYASRLSRVMPHDYQELCLMICLLFHYRQDGIAPNFTQKPAIKQEDGGKRMVFECQLTADPEASISWSRDGTELKAGGMELLSTLRLVICNFNYMILSKHLEQKQHTDLHQHSSRKLQTFLCAKFHVVFSSKIVPATKNKIGFLC